MGFVLFLEKWLIVCVVFSIVLQGGATGSTIAPLQLAAMMAHTKKSGGGNGSSVKK